VRQVHVDDSVGRYMVDLVGATREHDQVLMGASPRGALGLYRLSKAKAMMAGRDHVTPDDVQECAVPVLAHRMVLHAKARYGGVPAEAVIEQVLERVPVPT